MLGCFSNLMKNINLDIKNKHKKTEKALKRSNGISKQSTSRHHSQTIYRDEEKLERSKRGVILHVKLSLLRLTVKFSSRNHGDQGAVG